VPLPISVGGVRYRQNSNMAAVRHNCTSLCQLWFKYGIRAREKDSRHGGLNTPEAYLQ